MKIEELAIILQDTNKMCFYYCYYQRFTELDLFNIAQPLPLPLPLVQPILILAVPKAHTC